MFFKFTTAMSLIFGKKGEIFIKISYLPETITLLKVKFKRNRVYTVEDVFELRDDPEYPRYEWSSQKTRRHRKFPSEARVGVKTVRGRCSRCQRSSTRTSGAGESDGSTCRECGRTRGGGTRVSPQRGRQ